MNLCCCGGPPYSGGTGAMPNCFCTAIPASLAMTSSNPAANFGMFQSCAIAYGPTPAAYANLNLGANSFLSTQSFPDQLANGALFQYLLTCTYNEFSLSRVYAQSPFGSPFRDALLYLWVIGSNGNSCSPLVGGAGSPSLNLTNGLAFRGSDPVSLSIAG